MKIKNEINKMIHLNAWKYNEKINEKIIQINMTYYKWNEKYLEMSSPILHNKYTTCIFLLTYH